MSRIVAYPTVMDDRENGNNIFTVTFPDVPGAISEGKGIARALFNASEALGLILYDEEELPEPSDVKMVAKDNPDCVVSLVSVDLDEVTRDVTIPMVTRNTRIPSDLAIEAEKRHIDFSETLAEGLREKLRA